MKNNESLKQYESEVIRLSKKSVEKLEVVRNYSIEQCEKYIKQCDRYGNDTSMWKAALRNWKEYNHKELLESIINQKFNQVIEEMID